MLILFFFSSFLSTQHKTNQIAQEVTVELRGASIGWASKDKSSKKNVLEVKCFPQVLSDHWYDSAHMSVYARTCRAEAFV